MEISMQFQEEEGVVTTKNGNSYELNSLIESIKKFNDKCPKKGGLINRKHVGHTKEYTHITKNIRYENNELIADIEFIDEEIKNAKIKPIISTPLLFGNGVEINKILAIINICLEN